MLDELAHAIAVQRKKVVFITGAGLSVASGIPPFRQRRAGGLRPAMYKRSKKTAAAAALQSATTSSSSSDASSSDEAVPGEAIWDQVVWTTATRQAFRKDPVAWYNYFWWPHLGLHPGRAKPNAAHYALHQLCDDNLDTRCCQITQNIDGLQLQTRTTTTQTTTHSQQQSSEENDDDEPPTTTRTTRSATTTQSSSSSLIEIHGRVGLYKCLPDSDSDTDSDSDDEDDRPVQLGHRRKTRLLQQQQQQRPNKNSRSRRCCPYQYQHSLTTQQLQPDHVRQQILQMMMPSSSSSSNDTSTSRPQQDQNTQFNMLTEPPRCPTCHNLVMPQALMFDEGYHSHAFYQFQTAEDWLREAEILVFCGTSFAVRLTTVAWQRAREANLPVYNFNLHNHHSSGSGGGGSESLRVGSAWGMDVSHVIGPAQETLPRLWDKVRQLQLKMDNDSSSSYAQTV